MKFKTFCFNGKLFLHTVGHYSYLGVIAAIVFFFLFPAEVVSRLQSGQEYAQLWLGNFYDNNYSTHIFTTMLLGVIFGLVLFSYLHQSRQVSFFHAQPVIRPLLLAHRLLAGALLYGAACLINMLLSGIITSAFGLGSTFPWPDMIMLTAQNLMCFICIFMITALAAQLTGTLFAHIEITCFLLLLPAVAPLTLQILMQSRLSTYSPGPVSMLMLELSPLAAMFADGWGSLVYCVLLSALAAWLCFLLYHRRPLEKAGHAIIHPGFGRFVHISGGILCGLLMGMFFLSTSALENPLWTGSGMVLGVLLWHMIVQVQIHHAFRAALKNLPGLMAILAACIAVFVIVSTGCFGYDNIRFSSGQLSRIHLNLNYKDYLGHCFEDTEADISLSDPESKTAVLKLIASLDLGTVAPDKQTDSEIVKTQTLEALPEEPPQAADAEITEWISLICTYYPTLGLPTSHYYSGTIPTAERAQLTAILSLPEYRRQHIIYDFSPESAADYVWELEMYSSDKTRANLSLTLPSHAVPSFVEALQQDMLDRTIDLAEEEIIQVQILGNDGIYGFFPLYPSCTRTMKLLQDLNLIF